MQALQVHAGSSRLAASAAENACSAFEQLRFPLRDLIGMDIELLRQPGERLFPLMGG